MTGNGAGEASATLDPFQLWRQFYEVNEQAWTRAVKEMVGNWDYAGMQGKLLESFLSMQKMMMEGMSAQFKNLNIPTRDDVYQIGEVVVGVEEKVDRIDDQVVGVGDRLGAVEAELTQLDHRSSVLADRFSGVEGKVAQLEPRLAGLVEGLAGVESKLAQLDYRVAAVEERLVGLEKRQETRIEALDRRLQELDHRMAGWEKVAGPADKQGAASEASARQPTGARTSSRRAASAKKAE